MKILNAIEKFIASYNMRKWYNRCYEQFKKQNISDGRFAMRARDRHPVLHDRFKRVGIDRHYHYHIGWACRKLAAWQPSVHVDISSHIYFAVCVSAFVPVNYYEMSPPALELDNLSINKADILNLPFENESIDSLSCMHVIEHIGLGRYGDHLDAQGDLKAMAEISRVLARGGNLLVVVPVGAPLVAFNAHRIYSFEHVMHGFKQLHLKEFTLIPDNEQDGNLVYNAPLELAKKQHYAGGCFWFVKE